MEDAADITLNELLSRMLSKFGEWIITILQCCKSNMIVSKASQYYILTYVHTPYTENEDYARNIRPSSNSDFDPAYPQVFLLTSKWYKEPSFVMEQLQGLYPLHSVYVCVCVEGRGVGGSLKHRISSTNCVS